jgi:uncharacterized protein (DUF1778 family)
MPRRTTSKIQISASDVQKAKLAHAARARQMNVTQFVLSTSLDAADQMLDDEPNAIPALKAQLEKLTSLGL